jgi:hypothetical protein
MKRCSWLLAAIALSCGQTGQREVPLEAFAAGRAAGPISIGEFTVTLQVARVGLGPFYFCATEAASSSLCPTAQAELLATATVDALDPTPQALGTGAALTGTFRSAAYDFARTWLDTEHEPRATAGAPGGHSAHFEASVAGAGGQRFRVVVDLDIDPQHQGASAVQGARTTAEVGPRGARLDVTLDASAWWSRVDVTELAELAAAGADPVVVKPDSRAWNALVLAMTVQAPPTFAWTDQ